MQRQYRRDNHTYQWRYYNPALGRFVSADTIVPNPGDPQSLNRYSYVRNNPLKYTDPSGHIYGPDPYDPAALETYGEELSFWSMHYRSRGQYHVRQSHTPVYQYEQAIIDEYGYNSCGLIAAAAAMVSGADLLSEMKIIYDNTEENEHHTYGADTGIQPSPYAEALKRTYGNNRVAAHNKWNVGALFGSLNAGKVVIVDIQVCTYATSGETPTTEHDNFAHFARVLGIDWQSEEIYLENTLSGAAFWTVSLTAFGDVWQSPETSVRPQLKDVKSEGVTQWALTITSQ